MDTRRALTPRRPLALVTMSHAVQHFYSSGVTLTYPLVVSEFHVSIGTLGLVLTISGLLAGLLQGLAGLIRKTTARTLLSGQSVGLAATSLLGAAAPGFALFGAARILAACVYWPQHPIGSAYLTERYPGRRATVLSWHTTGGSIGTVVIPIAVAAVIHAFGWRWALVALAAPMALGGVVVATGLPREAEHPDAESTHGAGRAEGPPAPRLTVRDLLRSRTVLVVLAASTIAAAGRGLGTLSAYVPAYLQLHLRLSILTVGIVVTALVAASVVGPVMAGHVADRLGHLPVLLATYVAAAAALVAFPLVGGSLPALIPMAVVVGFLAYAESPLLQAVFSDAVEGANSRAAFGVFFAIAYGIGSLWFAVLGWVIDRFGYTAAFAAMGASFLVAGALLLMLRGEGGMAPATPAGEREAQEPR